MLGQYATRFVGAAVGVTRAFDAGAGIDQTRGSASAAVRIARAMRDAVPTLTGLGRRAVGGHATGDTLRARSVTKAMRAAAIQIRTTADTFTNGRVADLAIARCTISVRGALHANAARRAQIIGRAIGSGRTGLAAVAAERVADVTALAIVGRDALDAHAPWSADRGVCSAVGRGHARATRPVEEPRSARTTGRSQPKGRKQRERCALLPDPAHWH
jgi:hypothetical protein